MASSKQPTPRQLAYLDELKTRLRELRMRQVTFMEQTAQILSRMSSATMEEAAAAVAVAAAAASVAAKSSTITLKASDTASSGSAAGSGGKLNIKQLIQRFEDLRKTSQELDLPDVPEELINVDVRRILKGYEKLIEDGNVLQQSWYLLKKSTESCARLADANAKAKTKGHSEEASSVKMGFDSSTRSADVVAASRGPPPESRQQVVRVSRLSGSKSRRSNLVTSTEVFTKEREVFGPQEIYQEQDFKYKYRVHEYGRARWGAVLQLILRLPNLFRHCRKNKKVMSPPCSNGCHLPHKTATH
ncbi:uncharacterized protein Dana_GF15008, isoform A [Drosophila ananassae]|uniref:Uncharacterized protein, isoform A n=1 Tax=Drosophila ananassae TaxID=7217 RepID=B3MLF5_DROAN|nr:uncharacterized protein LOC6497823 isoform X1 [Drosophila ananassae]EDV30744.1 uncharacterized protein Dana_GF15008, isoform A [Drosophila ananassae]